MRRPLRSQRLQCFTLIEVLVALLVFAALGFAVSARIGDVAQQGFVLERRAIAHWVAQNQLQRLHLDRQQQIQQGQTSALTVGTRTERVFMGQRDWVVHIESIRTEQPLVNRVELAVYELDGNGDEVGPFDQVISFVGQY